MSSDADFLRARMGKVRPLANGNKVTLSKRAVDRSAAWQQRQIDAQEHSVDTSAASAVDGDTHLSWRAPDCDAFSFAQLREGHGIYADAEIDLHGNTIDGARVRLGQFIVQCQRRSQRRARIVHGRGLHSADGQPVLKAWLNDWLKQHSRVLAFCSARGDDGGLGALYVEFRR